VTTKLSVVALAVLCAAVASSAPAATTTTMAITKNGYVPKTLAIVTADAVTLANQDSVAHQVVLKPSTGFTCTAGLVIQPAQSSTCTFHTVTKYSVTDPNHKTSAFKGTITVKAGPPGSTLSLTATPKLVPYGGQSTLSGQLASGKSGQKIEVFAQECNANAMTGLTTVTTATGGAYTFTVQPKRNTSYQSKFKSSPSTAVVAKVKPKLLLRKLAARKFRMRALATDSFAGRFVLFQRWSTVKARWITVRSVVLRAGTSVTTPINPTSVSTATFRVKLRARLRVRALLTQAQAGTCYAASASTTIRS
jgi:plastocyanin